MDTHADAQRELAAICGSLTTMFDEIDQGTLEDLADRLDVVLDITQRVSGIQAVLMMALAERMDRDCVEIEHLGYLVRKQKRSNAGSDWKGARGAATSRIINGASVDIATGEIRPDWREIATRVVDQIERTMSLGEIKYGGFRALGLDPDEYIKTTNAGWQVTIEKGTPSHG